MNQYATKSDRPVPKFRFDVNWESIANNISFQSIDGLQVDKVVQKIGVRYAIISILKKVFRARKSDLVILRNVIFTSDTVLMALYEQVKEKKVLRRSIVVNLLDEDGKATLTWTLKNAWVRKISFSDLCSDANELAAYSVEVVHEGIQLAITPSAD
jgi:phage tail-like protein